jgi:hypothetical protein
LVGDIKPIERGGLYAVSPFILSAAVPGEGAERGRWWNTFRARNWKKRWEKEKRREEKRRKRGQYHLLF